VSLQALWRTGFVAYFLLLSWQLLTPVTIVSAGSWDKLIHFSGFFVLAVLAMLAARNVSVNKLAILLIVYAALTEILQHFIPGRSFSVLDWVADTIGIIFALLVSSKAIERFPFLVKYVNSV